MIGGLYMQENFKVKIPTTEILSFLVAARYECINSILLEDFVAKIAILKEQPKFSQLLSDFNEKTTRVQFNYCRI